MGFCKQLFIHWEISFERLNIYFLKLVKVYVYAIAMYFFRSDFSALTFQRFDHTGASFESREYWQCSDATRFETPDSRIWKKKKTFLGAGPFSSKPIGCSRLTYIPITCAVHRAVRDWQCSADDKNVIGMYVSTFQGVRQLSYRRSPPPRLPHPPTPAWG